MADKIAAVTGANRGIGFEIANQLLKQGFHVIVTARDEAKGAAAVEKLSASGRAEFLPLDVSNSDSVQQFIASVAEKHGRLDVLVNNAGVFLDKGMGPLEIGLDTVRETLEVNSLGPLYLIQQAVPLMKKNGYGRIVNLSSGMGALNEMTGGYLAYRVSKTCLNAITLVLAAELAGTGILVNAMCPGWVQTDMGGENAPRSTEEGADTAVWLSMLPSDGPTGQFFRDKKVIDW